MIALLTNRQGGLMIGSDVGSFIANFVILGIFWLVSRKQRPSVEVQRTGKPLSVCLLCLAAVIFLNE